MTAQELAMVAGLVLSLLFSYIPGLNTKYAALSKEVKQLIMVGVMFVVAGASYGLACSGFGADLGIGITCDRPGLMGLVTSFIGALIANQGTYMATPDAKSVKVVKAAAKAAQG